MNGDQTKTISFEEAQRQQQKKRTQQLSPAVAAQILTPAQQREIEADSYIQRGIELHEQDQLEEATYYFRLAAKGENPVGQLMYGLSLRHGWGCAPNPKDAIIYLQRAAAYAMSELKELMPGSSANIKALQQQHQKQQGISASSSTSTSPSSSSHPLRRMGTIDRRSAMVTARKELVMALYELGMSFLKGWGVQKDKLVAFHYFKLAADLGDADSQNETAQCFLDGIGTEKNAFEAARYYRLASAQGASQLGNSWIWKPKYDQYCEQQAAESATRKGRKDDLEISGGGPPGSATSITAGLASLTAGALAAPSAAASSSLASSEPGSDAQSLEQKRLSTATGRAAGPASRQGKYNLAGDLISSSQLELKIRQAEQLTKATVGPVLEPSSATGKKKHRWSLWGLHHHNQDRQHQKAPSFG
ncbi:hypothetical protein BGZ58_008820 [Dissophora ornata]|nr:hypothetical protein BGZ58_008820 [Dissophora ornata]